jgi:hypothetical protein
MEDSEQVRCKRGKHPGTRGNLTLRVRLGTGFPGASEMRIVSASKSESIKPVSVVRPVQFTNSKSCS